jgi:hypothetical protein
MFRKGEKARGAFPEHSGGWVITVGFMRKSTAEKHKRGA